MEIYAERFSDAEDFTFVFVGNIAPDALEPYLLRYVASLPITDRNESWIDPGIERPVGVVADEVRAGIEPQSHVTIIFHGDYEWSRENNHLLLSLADALRIRMREVLREDESGTYGVGVQASFHRIPRQRYIFQIYFGASPDRAEVLAALAMEIVDEFKTVLLADIYLTKVKATQQETFELDIMENRYWLSSIKNALLHDREFSTILTYPQFVAGLDSEGILTAARRYLDENRYLQVILYPLKTN